MINYMHVAYFLFMVLSATFNGKNIKMGVVNSRAASTKDPDQGIQTQPAKRIGQLGGFLHLGSAVVLK